MVRFQKKNKKGDYPRILVLAGVHGNELTAMKSAELFTGNLKYKEDRWFDDVPFGSITILNYINMYGLIHNTRETGNLENPLDLNRGYKESEDIRSIIKNEIKEADIVIDIHSSPRIINAMFLVDNGSKFPRKSISKYCDLPIVVWNSNNSTIKSYAMSLGKLGLTLETNGMEIIDEESAWMAFHALTNLLNNADTIWEEYKTESPLQYPEDKLFTYIKSDISGFIEYPSSKPYISPQDVIKVFSVGDRDHFLEYKIPERSFSVELHERDFINKGENLIGYQPNID